MPIKQLQTAQLSERVKHFKTNKQTNKQTNKSVESIKCEWNYSEIQTAHGPVGQNCNDIIW